jgi:two-component sensor histidine kinase
MNKDLDVPTAQVLIVEDDFLVSEMIRGVLKEIGYAVVGVAADGQQAVEMTRSMRPDVVLMDIELPGVDGIEATRRICKSCPTPVVVLTAYDAPELVERVSAAGAGAYLVKPSSAREMERAIVVAMARFDDMMELRRLNAELEVEIAERIQAEEKIKASLEEKEVLLEEIHHRVRNNLQFIRSLLDLQTDYIQDKQAVEVFRESRMRVHAIALVHEGVCQSEDLTRINFARYVQSLADDLFLSSGAGAAGIVLKVNVDDVVLDVNTAMYCGLIVNELLSSMLKCAFPGDRKGEICVDVHPVHDGRKLVIVVQNDGVSLSGDRGLRSKDSFGLRLVDMLVRQLKGTMEIDRSDGATFKITLSDHFGFCRAQAVT